MPETLEKGTSFHRHTSSGDEINKSIYQLGDAIGYPMTCNRLPHYMQ
jgi:hypothetical protein